jgi:hypothetical protein
MVGPNEQMPKPRTLSLRRETVRNLSSPLLSSQGHSLWTCDGSVREVARAGGSRTAEPSRDR